MTVSFWSWLESLWCSFEQNIAAHNGIGPVYGAIIGAILSSAFNVIALIWIAQRYSRTTKKIDSTFEFNKKYHDIIQDRQKINELYSPSKPFDETVSSYWWLRYFDLMLFELHFFQHGYVMKERFTEWMEWRRAEYKGEGPHKMETGGIPYRKAWENWKNLPAVSGSPLIPVLDAVHEAKDVMEVRRIVKKASSLWRWRLHLYCALIGNKLQKQFWAAPTKY